jgi:predicted RNase H-like HicB family nuclease
VTCFRRSETYPPGMSLSYPVVLIKSEEGFAVGCPALPGCWSQGATESEALANIRAAIQDYLAAVSESLRGSDVREVQVAF